MTSNQRQWNFVVFIVYNKFERLYLKTEGTKLSSVKKKTKKTYIALFIKPSSHTSRLVITTVKLSELISL